MIDTVYCACGLPLHYTNADTRRRIELMTRALGTHTTIIHVSGRYRVQRHYIALHGIIGEELADLARRGIVERLQAQT